MQKDVLDLFSGCGGLSLGFEDAGYNTIAGIERDESAAKTFEENLEAECFVDDLTEIEPTDFGRKDPDIIVGGPPCQDFSVCNYYSRGGDKTNLVFVFADWVEYFQPEVFVMENVPGIVSVRNVFQNLIKQFEQMGYVISSKILDSVNYSVPQTRQRMFIVGMKDSRYNFPEQKYGQLRTVEDAFADLPSVKSGEENDLFNNHKAPNHSNETIEKFRKLSFEEPVYESWGEKIRLHPNKPSPTLKAGKRSTFHFVHPFENRGLTIRERARLQSFPDSFIFHGTMTDKRTQTGNAVPPKLAKVIAEEIENASDKTGVFDY